MTQGDIVIAAFPGAHLTKTRPAVVLSTTMYQLNRPDVILGLITTRPVNPIGPTDWEIRDWKIAGLHSPSRFRLFVTTLLQLDVRVVGRLSEYDRQEVQERVRRGMIG